jgi:hypothetical protein
MIKGHAAIGELTRQAAVNQCYRESWKAACKHLRDNTVEEVLAEYLRVCRERGDDDDGRHRGDDDDDDGDDGGRRRGGGDDGGRRGGEGARAGQRSGPYRDDKGRYRGPRT